MSTFDEECDVLIVGSGSGGLTAALTAHSRGLRALVVEKAPWFGGTSALSGGGIWVPGASVQRRGGHMPDRDAKLRYLRNITHGIVSEPKLETYVDQAPRMLNFLEELDPDLEFVWQPGYPDYYPNVDGASDVGSTIYGAPIDLRRLGDDADKLYPALALMPKGLWLSPFELQKLYGIRQTWAGKRLFLKLLLRMVRAQLTGERRNATGPALMARMMLAVRKRNIDVWLESPMTSLIAEEGRVVGAVVDRKGKQVRVRAGGVVLASGGFEHHSEMRKQHQPLARTAWSFGVKENTGDGVNAAVEVGAALATMDSAWWMPAVEWAPGKPQFSLNERMLPAQIIVNGAGKRWINEAAPYEDFGFAMIAGEETGVQHIPSWYITDDWSWRRYVIFGHLPIPKIPFAPVPTGLRPPKAWTSSASFHTAPTLEELAGKIGVPANELVATVERYNKDAEQGIDTQFHRGETSYDKYYGDQTLAQPSLAPLHGGPYYAFRIVLADLGTNGGVVTDEYGRTMRQDDTPIDGLYATGNVASSVMGRSYAGAGATIGPAMTFGYIAANHIADHLALKPEADVY